MTQLSFVKYALVALLFAAACDSDNTEKNPSFNAGTGGKHSKQDAGPDAAAPPSGTGGKGKVVDASMGSGGGGGLDASTGTGGNPADAGSSAGMPGAGGAPEADAAPPYDCILNPRNHAEIINACTDAVRIEKHPTLPAVPMH